MNIPFTRHRKIYFAFSGLVILVSLVFLVVFGLRPGIDFTGGSILEIEYLKERPSNQEILESLANLDLGSVYVQPTGEKGVILRMKNIDESTHQKIINELDIREARIENGELIIGEESILEEKRFESIGPTIGQELKQKTKIVIGLVLLAIVIYIALAFRKIQRPLRSWQYGIASVLALFHDILIPLGVFSVLGRFYGVEISIPVITALLAVLGYSVNNTVVVFDRIRENLLKRGGFFEEIIDRSLNQTLARQINTSLTTLFVVLAVFLFGGETLKYFALALILGVVAGTYSSIFLAGSLLVAWKAWFESHRLKWKNRG